jgi:hypothetical protein
LNEHLTTFIAVTGDSILMDTDPTSSGTENVPTPLTPAERESRVDACLEMQRRLQRLGKKEELSNISISPDADTQPFSFDDISTGLLRQSTDSQLYGIQQQLVAAVEQHCPFPEDETITRFLALRAKRKKGTLPPLARQIGTFDSARNLSAEPELLALCQQIEKLPEDREQKEKRDSVSAPAPQNRPGPTVRRRTDLPKELPAPAVPNVPREAPEANPAEARPAEEKGSGAASGATQAPAISAIKVRIVLARFCELHEKSGGKHPLVQKPLPEEELRRYSAPDVEELLQELQTAIEKLPEAEPTAPAAPPVVTAAQPATVAPVTPETVAAQHWADNPWVRGGILAAAVLIAFAAWAAWPEAVDGTSVENNQSAAPSSSDELLNDIKRIRASRQP